MQKHDNLAAALEFNDYTGAALFPIIGFEAGQFFCPKGFKWRSMSSSDPDAIRAMAKDHPGCAFGIDLGKSGLFVLDVDQKPGKDDGVAKLKAFLDEGHEIKETFKVKTPSGKGGHLYYWGHGRTTNGADTDLGKGLDTRGEGGMVPAPGQHVPGKGAYTVARHTAIYDVPEWIIEKTGGKKKASAERKDDLGIEPDQPHNIKDAIKYLQRAETVEEGCRDSGTYRVACAVRDYGISMEMCESLMADFWVNRCDMGDWGLDEVQAKIESAYERAAGDFGNKDLSRHFKDVTKMEMDGESPTEQKVRLPYLEKLKGAIKSMADIEPAAIPPRKWLVHGRFLEAFVTVTISPGGVGKSTMSMLEGLAVACNKGKEWLNRKTFGIKGVWIYNLEDPQAELDRKGAAFAQHYNIDLKTLDHFYLSSGLTMGLTIARPQKGGGIEINYRALQACKDFIVEREIKLWVIDPLVKAHQINENDNGEMDRLMTELSRIATDTGCSIHLVHHTRKKNNDTGNGDADTARGASSVVNAARVAHTLNGMGSKEAALYGLGEEKGWYLRVDDAKANLTPPADKAEWFKRHSIKLDNGDYVGVLEYTNIQKLVDSVPFNQLLIEQVMAIAPDGMIPTNNIAKQLELTGEITKEDGQPMGAPGIRRAIERVFTNTVEHKGKVAKVTMGEKRPRTGFPKSTTSWLDCEYSKELLDAQAVGDAKRLGSGKEG